MRLCRRARKQCQNCDGTKCTQEPAHYVLTSLFEVSRVSIHGLEAYDQLRLDQTRAVDRGNNAQPRHPPWSVTIGNKVPLPESGHRPGPAWSTIFDREDARQ
jgi:hypothetical protein